MVVICNNGRIGTESKSHEILMIFNAGGYDFSLPVPNAFADVAHQGEGMK